MHEKYTCKIHCALYDEKYKFYKVQKRRAVGVPKGARRINAGAGGLSSCCKGENGLRVGVLPYGGARKLVSVEE